MKPRQRPLNYRPLMETLGDRAMCGSGYVLMQGLLVVELVRHVDELFAPAPSLGGFDTCIDLNVKADAVDHNEPIIIDRLTSTLTWGESGWMQRASLNTPLWLDTCIAL